MARRFGYSLYDVDPSGDRFVMLDTPQRDPAPLALKLVVTWTGELKGLLPIR